MGSYSEIPFDKANDKYGVFYGAYLIAEGAKDYGGWNGTTHRGVNWFPIYGDLLNDFLRIRFDLFRFTVVNFVLNKSSKNTHVKVKVLFNLDQLLAEGVNINHLPEKLSQSISFQGTNSFTNN